MTVVGSLVLTGRDPPPKTVTVFICGELAFGKTTTVTVIGG
jgi:hypothetical protein